MIGREDNVASHTVSEWRGIAFEELCFAHIGLQMTLVTTFGLKYGYHSGVFQQVVTLDHLF